MFKQVRICQGILRQNPKFQAQLNTLFPSLSYANFATAAPAQGGQQVKSTYEKSRERYHEHLKAFREKT